jgi:hypothetical protein
MAKQLTVFVENRPGRIRSVSEILLENNLNVWAFTIQDRGEFGLMKMIIDKPKQAQLVLSEKNFACAIKDVIAITAKDKAGNLDKLTTVLADLDVNVSDAYGFVSPTDRQGMCFLEIKEKRNSEIQEALEKAGFEILDDEELYAGL